MDEKSYNRQISDAIGPITSQDILDKYNITEYTVDDLIRDFEYAYSYKTYLTVKTAYNHNSI